MMGRVAHMFPDNCSDVVNGLADFPEVPAIPHVAPEQDTQEGDVEAKYGSLRERLDAKHVQDTGDEVGHSHQRHQNCRRAVGIHDVFALISFEERLISLRYFLLESFFKPTAERFASHFMCAVELLQTQLSQLFMLGLKLLRSKVRSLGSTQLRKRREGDTVCIHTENRGKHSEWRRLPLTFSISLMYLSLAAFWAFRLLASAVACQDTHRE